MATRKPKAETGEPPASKRGRQKGETQHLPTMAPEKNPRVHPAALKYVKARDHRMELGREEVKAKDALLTIMEAEGLVLYEWDDINVVVTADKTVRVKRAKSEEDEDQ